MRGRRLSLAITLSLVAVGLTACDWPQWGGGPALTGNAAAESTISAANVATLGLSFYSTLGGAQPGGSSPVVAGGRVYVTTSEGLFAFDAAGKTGCSGTPSSCDPLWRTSVLTRNTPAVGDSTVFATDGSLDAFDAAGQINCTGGVCSPLWTGTVASGVDLTSPTVSNGTVYVAGSGGSVSGGVVYAFDEAGQTNCSGTPKICSPLWTAATGGEVLPPPAVSNGVLYAGSSNLELYAFDATGQTNCSGTPKTCSPLWKGATDGSGSVAVSDGDVYVGGSDLVAFDASGERDCSGTPKVCTALWTGPGGGALAVANGVVYTAGGPGLEAFDGAGQTNCSTVTKICNPLWSASVGGGFGTPSVGNQVVYASNSDGDIYAFDASGTTDCSGSPTVCSPLASFAADGGNGQVAVVNGTLYTGYFGLFAYNLTGTHDFAPIVVVNPASSDDIPGDPVGLSAAAIGDPEPTIQWYENGAPIPGANSDRYTYIPTGPPGATFYVKFTNTYGTATSASATITVISLPG